LKRWKGNPGMKAIRIGADYRPNKVTHYDYLVNDNVSVTKVRKWFKNTYTWLDIKEAKIIPLKEAVNPTQLFDVKGG